MHNKVYGAVRDGGRGEQKMSRKEEVYIPALEGKKIPLLTLDNKWHKLFTQTSDNAKIRELEKELNELIKKQGKYTTESQKLKKIKKKLMDEIVLLAEKAEQDSGKKKKIDKKIEENRRLVNECNEKYEQMQDELLELPRSMNQVNKELMLATMEVCYDKIQSNTKEIDELSEWVANMRVELKKNLIRKQEREINNQELYYYMHDVFGPEVMEIFDIKYNPEERIKKKKEEEKEQDASNTL